MAGFRPAIATERFFDWASTSPVSAAAARAMRLFSQEQEASSCPPEFLTRATAHTDRLRQALHHHLRAAPEQRVVLVRSVAEAVSMLACGLSVPPGAEVAVTETDHEAVVLPWAHRGDVRLRTIGCLPSGLVDLAAAEKVITADTAVVSLAHVSHLDGIVQPVRELVKIVRSRSDALLVVDGAQAVGRIPVNLVELGADIYLGTGRKALLAPLGTAFLVATGRVLDRIRPTLLSTRSATLTLGPSGNWQRHTVSTDPVRRLEGNLPDLRCLTGLRASLLAYQASDPSALAHRTTLLAQALLDTAPAAGLVPVRPIETTPVGIVRLHVAEGDDHLRLKEALRGHGFHLAATRQWLRISLHGCDEHADINGLIHRIREAR